MQDVYKPLRQPYSNSMTFQCFSQHLLNPYRGITSTIRYQSAEAVTADGVTWGVYVIDGGLLEGLPQDGKTMVSDIRYGSWTETGRP